MGAEADAVLEHAQQLRPRYHPMQRKRGVCKAHRTSALAHFVFPQGQRASRCERANGEQETHADTASLERDLIHCIHAVQAAYRTIRARWTKECWNIALSKLVDQAGNTKLQRQSISPDENINRSLPLLIPPKANQVSDPYNLY